MQKVCLLTGQPGSGKTSLLKTLIGDMAGKAGGFFTEEIRAQQSRVGFRLITLSGESAVLAHVKIQSRPYSVGRYGVDIGVLENLGVAAIIRAIAERELIVIDEIGKMELFSDKFKAAVLQAIESGKKLLGTIMLKPHPWADALKRRPEVYVIPVTHTNYQLAQEEIRRWLSTPERGGN
jgi:nucleoside-triphosphatase